MFRKFLFLALWCFFIVSCSPKIDSSSQESYLISMSKMKEKNKENKVLIDDALYEIAQDVIRNNPEKGEEILEDLDISDMFQELMVDSFSGSDVDTDAYAEKLEKKFRKTVMDNIYEILGDTISGMSVDQIISLGDESKVERERIEKEKRLEEIDSLIKTYNQEKNDRKNIENSIDVLNGYLKILDDNSWISYGDAYSLEVKNKNDKGIKKIDFLIHVWSHSKDEGLVLLDSQNTSIFEDIKPSESKIVVLDFSSEGIDKSTNGNFISFDILEITYFDDSKLDSKFDKNSLSRLNKLLLLEGEEEFNPIDSNYSKDLALQLREKEIIHLGKKLEESEIKPKIEFISLDFSYSENDESLDDVRSYEISLKNNYDSFVKRVCWEAKLFSYGRALEWDSVQACHSSEEGIDPGKSFSARSTMKQSLKGRPDAVILVDITEATDHQGNIIFKKFSNDDYLKILERLFKLGGISNAEKDKKIRLEDNLEKIKNQIDFEIKSLALSKKEFERIVNSVVFDNFTIKPPNGRFGGKKENVTWENLGGDTVGTVMDTIRTLEELNELYEELDYMKYFEKIWENEELIRNKKDMLEKIIEADGYLMIEFDVQDKSKHNLQTWELFLRYKSKIDNTVLAEGKVAFGVQNFPGEDNFSLTMFPGKLFDIFDPTEHWITENTRFKPLMGEVDADWMLESKSWYLSPRYFEFDVLDFKGIDGESFFGPNDYFSRVQQERLTALIKASANLD